MKDVRKSRKLPKSVRSKTTGAFLETKKAPTKIIGPVERLLISDAERSVHARDDGIHPSDLSGSEWCPRRSYYQLSGMERDVDPPAITPQAERVFEEGHSIHNKWQTWLWRLGVLEGVFSCLCGWKGWAYSPKTCPSCGEKAIDDWDGPLCMRYREVPVSDPEHLLVGKADGKVGGELIEVKSVGIGTIRYYAPDLHGRYAAKEITADEMWREIKRPFPSHVKQANIYLHCHKAESMRFIYEWKAGQGVKEFVIKHNRRVIQSLLDDCLDVKYALKVGEVPHRPLWTVTDREESPTCKNCGYRKTCWDEEEAVEGPVVRVRRRIRS